ncbi:MAG: phosphoadenylyl-sulfate reductase [Cyclobacteriaceae bacterium]
MSRIIFEQIEQECFGLSEIEVLQLLSERFGSRAKFSTSFGLEDQVITHMIANADLEIEIFTIDTGRLFQETYDVFDLTRKKYGVNIATYSPSTEQLQQLIKSKGPNSFYESVENRKECCFIRKVEPLQRALDGAGVWITGLRSEQSINRSSMNVLEWDEQYHVIKYNPLLSWTEEGVRSFVEENNIPINSLHKKGYPSIGCAPCTRAVLPGEDSRAGRWWWESSSKECGLHEKRLQVSVR